MGIYVGDIWYPGQDDILTATAAHDFMWGLGGDDVLRGNAGDDWLMGGFGNDTLRGGADDDVLFGQQGNDTLFGGADQDILVGGLDNDFLDGGAGVDSSFGGVGNDLIEFDQVDAIMDGGVGEDTLVNNTAGDVELGLGNISDIEIVDLSASAGADSLMGSGSYIDLDPVTSTFTTHADLITADDVSSATDAANTMTVEGDLNDEVRLDTDWSWMGLDGDGYGLYQSMDSAGNTVNLTVDYEVTVTHF